MYTNTINLWEGREDVTLTSYCMEKNDEIIGCDRRPAVIILPVVDMRDLRKEKERR